MLNTPPLTRHKITDLTSCVHQLSNEFIIWCWSHISIHYIKIKNHCFIFLESIKLYLNVQELSLHVFYIKLGKF